MKIRKKSLINSGVWNILSIIITAIGAFVSMPIIINGIGTDNYGLFSIILMIGGFAALQDFGLGEATLRFVSHYMGKSDLDGVNRVVQSTMTVYIMTLIFVFLILQIFAVPIIHLFKLEPSQIEIGLKAFRIACLSFFLATIAQSLQKIPEAILRYDISNKINIILVVLRFTLMILVVKIGFGLLGLVWILVVISFFKLISFYLISLKLIPGLLIIPKYNKDGVKEVFSFSLYSFTNQIISQISLNADRLVLGIFFSTSAVGFLSAPKDIIQRLSGITGGAGQALFPKFTSMEINSEMSDLYAHSLWILSILSMVLLVPLSIIIPNFLTVWISADFAKNSSDFARLFSLGMAFNGGVIVYFSLLKAINKINILTKIMSTLTIVSVVATVALVYKYGVIGSGIRTILFSWISSIICIVIGKRIFHHNYSRIAIIEFSVLLPFSGLVIYYIGSQILVEYIYDDWINIVLNYVFYAILTLGFSLLVNLTIFQRFGTGYYIYKIIRNKLLI